MLRKIILGILLLLTVLSPLIGIWESISGTKDIANDTALVEFINKHGAEGESYTKIELKTNINHQVLSMQLVLTPKGRFAVLKDGIFTGLGAGICFALVAFLWRDRPSQEKS